MKKIICFFVSFLSFFSFSHGTTVTLVGSSGAPSFFGTDGSFLDSSGVDSVQVGTFSNWDFGDSITDLPMMGFSELGKAELGNIFGQLGKLKGSASDNTVLADSFNNQKIYLVINDGDTNFFGIASGSDTQNWTFPVNDNGFSDFIDVTITDKIDQISGLNVVAGGFQVVSQVVPEPSTYALLAGILSIGYVVVRRSRSRA